MLEGFYKRTTIKRKGSRKSSHKGTHTSRKAEGIICVSNLSASFGVVVVVVAVDIYPCRLDHDWVTTAESGKAAELDVILSVATRLRCDVDILICRGSMFSRMKRGAYIARGCTKKCAESCAESCRQSSQKVVPPEAVQPYGRVILPVHEPL